MGPRSARSPPSSRNIKSNSIDEFRDTKTEVIVYPPQFKTGEVIYPYENAIVK